MYSDQQANEQTPPRRRKIRGFHDSQRGHDGEALPQSSSARHGWRSKHVNAPCRPCSRCSSRPPHAQSIVEVAEVFLCACLAGQGRVDAGHDAREGRAWPAVACGLSAPRPTGPGERGQRDPHQPHRVHGTRRRQRAPLKKKKTSVIKRVGHHAEALTPRANG